MDVSDVEDMLFDMCDKGIFMLDWLYETTHVWETREEDAFRPRTSWQLQTNKLFKIKDLLPLGLPDELHEITKTEQQKLLQYAVGCDHEKLEALYKVTHESITSLKHAMNALLHRDFNFDAGDLEEENKRFGEHLARLDTLSFEGQGGLEDEDYGMWYQLMYSLITCIRWCLNKLMCFVGCEPDKNSFAEAYIKRPFFFQIPLSPKEYDEVEAQRTRLKTTIQQLQELQEVLCKALITYFNYNEIQSERSESSASSIASDLTCASLSTDDTDDSSLIINLYALEEKNCEQSLICS